MGGRGVDKHTERETNKKTHTHINTMNWPGLVAGPSENAKNKRLPIQFLKSYWEYLHPKKLFRDFYIYIFF